MRARVLAVAVAVALVLSVASVLAVLPAPAGASPQTDAGVTWLRTKQQPDGGFEVAGFPGFETPDAILALAMAGQADASWSTAEARAAVLGTLTAGKRSPLDALDDWVDSPGFDAGQAGKVLALVAAPLGLDPSAFDWGCDGGSGTDLVRILGAPDGAGRYAPDGAFNKTLFAAIGARAALGAVPASTVSYIRSKQKSDGSWSFDGVATGTGGDVDTTALALRALAAAGISTGDADYDQGVAYLEAAQQGTGAWRSFGADDTNSTAVAVLALAPTGDGNLAQADAYLLGRQLASPPSDAGRFQSPNDGFGVNTSATAQAVQALLRPSIGFPAADAAPDCGIGRDTSNVVFTNEPHVFSVGADSLRHDWLAGSTWRSEGLDGPGSSPARPGQTANAIGPHTAAISYQGGPHVFYFDAAAGGLRHAWYSPQWGWGFEQLDGTGAVPLHPGQTTNRVGEYPTAVLALGGLHVFYADGTDGALRHAWYEPAVGWRFETLDGTSTTAGRVTNDVGDFAAAVTYQGLPQVFYRDDTTGRLRHAALTIFGWLIADLDGAGGSNRRTTDDVGRHISVTLFLGQPHVFYESDGPRTLRHAWYDPVWGWVFETLDGTPGANGRTDDLVGRFTAARLYDGLPHVWYLDDTTGRQRHAWWTGFVWRYENLDGAGAAPSGRGGPIAGTDQSALLLGGRLSVWYRSTDGSAGALRHAFYVVGAGWRYETLAAP